MTLNQKTNYLNYYKELSTGRMDPVNGEIEKLLRNILIAYVLEIQLAESRGEVVPGVLMRRSRHKISSINLSDTYVVAQICRSNGIPAKAVRKYPGLIELWRAKIQTYRALRE